MTDPLLGKQKKRLESLDGTLSPLPRWTRWTADPAKIRATDTRRS